MLRVLGIAAVFIAMSCASGGDAAQGTDAHVNHPDGQAPSGDGPITPDGHTAIDAPAGSPDAAFACKPANIIHGDGKHNPGMDCMDSCHSHGFSVAGTVYDADGVTPASDATVTVVDASGNAQDVIVSTNGNFFSYFPVAYPITIRASLCPSVQVMTTQATAGGCNANGCHMSGGVQGTIHL